MALEKVTISLLATSNKPRILYTGKNIHVQLENNTSPVIAVDKGTNKAIFTLSENGSLERLAFPGQKYNFIITVSEYWVAVTSATSGDEIYRINFGKIIKGIKYTKELMAVFTIGEYYIYQLQRKKLLHIVKSPSLNPEAIFDLTVCAGRILLAVSGNESCGSVHIENIKTKTPHGIIAAHKSRLACLVFSPDGSKIATASIKGTIIRVYSTDNFTKLYELIRGISRHVEISINFSICGRYICSTSNTTTIHIFKVDRGEGEKANETWVNWAKNLVSSEMEQKTFFEDRSCATAALPAGHLQSVASIVRIEEKYAVIVVTNDGKLHLYNFTENEKYCTLLKTYELSL